MEAYTKAQPLGRFGHVRDIADATVYLFSDTGSYVSGQTLVGELSDNTKQYDKGFILIHSSGWCKLAHVGGWCFQWELVLPGLLAFGR